MLTTTRIDFIFDDLGSTAVSSVGVRQGRPGFDSQWDLFIAYITHTRYSLYSDVISVNVLKVFKHVFPIIRGITFCMLF